MTISKPLLCWLLYGLLPFTAIPFVAALLLAVISVLVVLVLAAPCYLVVVALRNLKGDW